MSVLVKSKRFQGYKRQWWGEVDVAHWKLKEIKNEVCSLNRFGNGGQMFFLAKLHFRASSPYELNKKLYLIKA